MKRIRRRRALWRTAASRVVTAAVVVVGCTEVADSPVSLPEDAPAPVPGLVVSEARAAESSAGNSGPGVLTDYVAYISAAPGTLPDAISVVARNITRGDPPSAPIRFDDGGFDPVAVPARSQDILELSITRAISPTNHQVFVTTIQVPSRRSPAVVRVRPAHGRTDVASLEKPIVVFSEPIDPESLTSTAIKLLRDGVAIAGSIALVADNPFTVEFAPDSPLRPNQLHEFVVTRGVHDFNGDPLSAEVRIEFTTLDSGVLVISNLTTGSALDADGYGVRVAVVGGQAIYGRLDLNDTLHIDGLPESEVVLELDDVADNCAVEAGVSRTVTLQSGSPVEVVFRVSCAAAPELGSVGLIISRYTDADGVRSSFYRMNADGTALRRLTNDVDLDRRPAVSPDGQRVAFSRGNFSGGWGESLLHVVNSDGSGITQLTPEPFGELPSWSPDNSKIAFYVNAGRLDVIGADGTGRRTLFTGAIANGREVWPAWSPDGSKVAFLRLAIGTGVYWEVWTVNVADGATTRVGQFGDSKTVPARLAWTNEGIKALALIGDALWIIDAGDATAVRASDHAIDFQSVEITDWSPDQRLVALAASRSPAGWLHGPDIYLLNLANGTFVRVTADGSSFDAAFFPK